MKKRILMSVMVLTATVASSFAADHQMTVNTKKLGAPVQNTMYGIFFEDINYAADGGLYAELIMNRSFEFPNSFAGWTVSGNVTVKDDGPFERNPHYVRLGNPGHAHKHTMIENHGFFGIGVKKGEEYKFSVWARCPQGGKAKLWIDLVDNATMGESQMFCNASVEVEGKEWKKYTATMKPNRTFAKAHLRLWGDSRVTIDVEHVSLFPKDVYKGDENGLRKDIAETLEQIKPGLLRFPGGCIVEGTDLATRYQWKNTVGPVENRPLNENRWHYTFTSRYYPDYYQSYGLGFYEFFRFAEQIGAEPLPVLNVGMSCQYQNDIKNEAKVHVALDQLQPYIDDCIDLIDFANGDPSTNKWAKLRAEMGHPAPFNLKFIGVGNEQWDYKDNAAFTSRLKIFMEAIRKAHPEIKIIGSTGPDSEGDRFNMLQPKMKELGADLYDEHFYRNEQWFLDNTNTLRYEKYDRKGPKVFAGEYACHGKGKKYNHYETAILEAGFMTDFERNADVVHMTAYAPLLAHVEGWQWRPDLVWYDNLNVFKTTSYYVQQLYAQNKGTNVLPLTMLTMPAETASDAARKAKPVAKPVAALPGQDGLEASAVYDKEQNCIIVKVANTSKTPQSIDVALKDMKTFQPNAEVITLHHTDLNAENTLEKPNLIAPKTSTLTLKVEGKTPVISDELPAMSFKVYKVKY